MKILFLLLSLLVCLTSCLNNDKAADRDKIEPTAIYYDYKVWAEEGQDVTVRLQYRLRGEDGKTILLNDPSEVSLDGTALTPDSANLTGIFYELAKPLEEFTGKHTITFTDSRKKEHKQEFVFHPFALAEEIPEKMPKSPFTIRFQDFPAERTIIRLVMIDTSFTTLDVNEELKIENRELTIDAEMLANLSRGPITLEIQREEVVPLKNASRAGGRLVISYVLRRHFEFVD